MSAVASANIPSYCEKTLTKESIGPSCNVYRQRTFSQLDKECDALHCLHDGTLNHLKLGIPLWEEIAKQAVRLHSALKASAAASSGFLDSLQKLADLSNNSKGATRELGMSLTRLVLRERALLESRPRGMSSALVEHLVPLQERLDDWRRAIAALDKESTRDSKKARAEVKRTLTEVARLRKKTKRSGAGKQSSSSSAASASAADREMSAQLEAATGEALEKYEALEECERSACKRVLIEERSRYCTLIAALRPFLDQQLSLTRDLNTFEEVVTRLCSQGLDSDVLPAETEQYLSDLLKSPELLLHTFEASKSAASASSSAAAAAGSSSQAQAQRSSSTLASAAAAAAALRSSYSSLSTASVSGASPSASSNPSEYNDSSPYSSSNIVHIESDATDSRGGAKRFDSLPRSLSRLVSNGSTSTSASASSSTGAPGPQGFGGMSSSHISLPFSSDSAGDGAGAGSAMKSSSVLVGQAVSDTDSLQYACLACLSLPSGLCQLHEAQARALSATTAASASASAPDELSTPSGERPPFALPLSSASGASSSQYAATGAATASRASCALASSAQQLSGGVSGASLNSHGDAESQDSGLCSQSQQPATSLDELHARLSGLRARNTSGGCARTGSGSGLQSSSDSGFLRPEEYSAMQILDSVIKASENLMAQSSHRPSKASLGPLPMCGGGDSASASASGSGSLSLCSSNPDAEHDAALAFGRSNSRAAGGRVGVDSSNPSPVSTWTNWPELPVADAWRNELQNSHPYTVCAPQSSNKTKNAARMPIAQIFENVNVTVGPYGTLKKRHDHPPPPPPHRVSDIRELSESLDGSNAQLADETLKAEAATAGVPPHPQSDFADFPAPPDARLLATLAPSTGEARPSASPRSDAATDEEDNLPLPPPPSDFSDLAAAFGSGNPESLSLNPADNLTPTSPYASCPITPATATECSYAYVQFGSLQRPTSVPGTSKGSAGQFDRASCYGVPTATPYAAACSTFHSANMQLPPPKLLATASPQPGDKKNAGRSVSTAGKPPLPVAPRPRRPESVSSMAMVTSSTEALEAIAPDELNKPKFILGDGDTISVGSLGCGNSRRSPVTCSKPNPPARRSSIVPQPQPQMQHSTAAAAQRPQQVVSCSTLPHSAAATPVVPVDSAATARLSARFSALLDPSPGSNEASKQAAVSSELKLALLSRMLKSATLPTQQQQHQQPQLQVQSQLSSFGRGGATPVPLPVIPGSAEWVFRDRLMRDIERGVQLRILPQLQPQPPQIRK